MFIFTHGPMIWLRSLYLDLIMPIPEFAYRKIYTPSFPTYMTIFLFYNIQKTLETIPQIISIQYKIQEFKFINY